MASLLIHIKSKTLLPRDPSGVEGDSEDPRRELVERLLEHERFKAAAQMLMQKQQIEEATWTTPGLRNFRRDAGEAGARHSTKTTRSPPTPSTSSASSARSSAASALVPSSMSMRSPSPSRR